MVTESKFSEQIVRFQSLFWNERLVFSPRKKMHWVPQLVFFPSIFFVSRLSFVGKQEIFFGHVHFSRIFRAVERSKIWTTPYFRLEKETFAHTGCRGKFCDESHFRSTCSLFTTDAFVLMSTRAPAKRPNSVETPRDSPPGDDRIARVPPRSARARGWGARWPTVR